MGNLARTAKQPGPSQPVFGPQRASPVSRGPAECEVIAFFVGAATPSVATDAGIIAQPAQPLPTILELHLLLAQHGGCGRQPGFAPQPHSPASPGRPVGYQPQAQQGHRPANAGNPQPALFFLAQAGGFGGRGRQGQLGAQLGRETGARRHGRHGRVQPARQVHQPGQLPYKDNPLQHCANAEPFIIGRDVWSGLPNQQEPAAFFRGLMGEVKVWARALTPAEVAAEAAK